MTRVPIKASAIAASLGAMSDQLEQFRADILELEERRRDVVALPEARADKFASIERQVQRLADAVFAGLPQPTGDMGASTTHRSS